MRDRGMTVREENKRRPFLALALALMSVMFGAAVALAARPSHMERHSNPEGCAGCHAGMGAPNTPLLKAQREELCFQCHGTFSRGRASGRDIEGVLTKVSRHPILDTSRYHIRGEELPEIESSMPRHVACDDCHSAHLSNPEVPWRGSRGYISARTRIRQPGLPPLGLKLKLASEEYELCYLCHSDSANLPIGSRNMAELFDPANASYHPVEAPGLNTNVPSLVRALSVTSRITCTDCHGNSDPGGPKGPHGSDYVPLLVAEYRTEDGPEGPKEYELCYMCHDRRSILGDESFRKHNRHVVSEATSCFTCHASHGSFTDRHLIEFNTLVVGSSPSSGGPMYIPGAAGNPRCYLSCHGVDHSTSGVGGNPWP